MNCLSSKCFIVFLMVLILPPHSTIAQELERSVYSGSGRTISMGSLSVDYNLGEVVVFTGTIPGAILTQGFEQSDFSLITDSPHHNFTNKMNAFPNPVKDQLTIHYSAGVKVEELKIELWDVYGKRTEISAVHSGSLFDQNFSFDLSGYATGVYFVKVFSLLTNVSETFKIIKI